MDLRKVSLSHALLLLVVSRLSFVADDYHPIMDCVNAHKVDLEARAEVSF